MILSVVSKFETTGKSCKQKPCRSEEEEKEDNIEAKSLHSNSMSTEGIEDVGGASEIQH